MVNVPAADGDSEMPDRVGQTDECREPGKCVAETRSPISAVLGEPADTLRSRRHT
jgi:hypothetical protein